MLLLALAQGDPPELVVSRYLVLEFFLDPQLVNIERIENSRNLLNDIFLFDIPALALRIFGFCASIVDVTMGIPILLVLELLTGRDARPAETAGDQLRKGELLIIVFIDLAPDELCLRLII